MRSYGSRSFVAAVALLAGLFITAPGLAQRAAPPTESEPAADRATPPSDVPADRAAPDTAVAPRADRDVVFSGLAAPQRRQIQQNLQERGFYQGAIDGLYGPATREALSAYQRAERLEVTGRADRATLRAMGVQGDEVQRVRGMQDEPRATTEGTEIPIADRGQTVRHAQEVLAREGFHHGSIDGLLGPTTAGWIRAFQESRGLAVTGDLTPDTLSALGVSAERAPQLAAEQPRAAEEPNARRPNAPVPDADAPPPGGVPHGR